MSEYYFDIETYSPEEKPNPERDKIVAIQFQRIDLRTGKPNGELTILKEWESSEENIVKELFHQFFSDGTSVWNFIPVGFNLNFEWEFLIAKFEKYIGKKLTSRNLHYERPHLDLRPIVVLLNGGSFKGAKLDKFTSKPCDGKSIKDWYEKKEFDKIEEYIKNEADAVLEFLQRIEIHVKKSAE